MRLLVLGGTKFVGRHIVGAALDGGHDVTLFHRGRTGAGLFGEAEHVLGDRHADLDRLAGRRFDAVIDTSGYTPDAVRASVAAVDAERYVFISTVSVYDHAVAPAREDSPLKPPGDDYGGAKVACERELPDGALIVRPGVVAGPHDPTDRFTYWAVRTGEVLAPAPPDAPVQVIDARDLAAFVVGATEAGRSGAYNAAGEQLPFSALLEGADPEWVSEAFLHEHGVTYEDLPLWVPESAGMPGLFAVDSSRAVAAGLRRRPVAETAADTVAWLGESFVDGFLRRERERDLLAAWRRLS